MRIVAAVLMLLPLSAVAAHAHGFLDNAEPRAGSTVQDAPREVVLSFTQDLEPAFTGAEVRDAGGTRVDQGGPTISASTMHLGLKALGPGAYKVTWHALSVDTHTSQGSFNFRVGP